MANRALVGLASLLVLAFGVVATLSLDRELIPSLEIPVSTVVTPVPGASPGVVEQQVTAPLETAIGGVAGVTTTRSTSSAGLSAVTVELEYGSELAKVQRELEQAVDGVEGLPQGAEPAVVSGSVDDIPGGAARCRVRSR